MAHYDLQGTTKTRDSTLDEHKDLRDTLKYLTELIDEILPLYKASLARLGEAVILSNVQKPTQKVKENEETRTYIPNKRTR